VLKKNNPKNSATLMQQASDWSARRFDLYEKMAAMTFTVCPVNKE
jgi:pyruvate-ferredoxin/flavodoxin oxidoreductase